MTKGELIDVVAEQTELSKRQVGIVLESMLETIRETLAAGDKVALIPFGSFEVRDRKGREGRNPKTGEKLVIKARRVPAFSAGKSLRDALAEPKKKRPGKHV